MTTPISSRRCTWTDTSGVIEASLLLDELDTNSIPESFLVKSAKTGKVQKFVYGRTLVNREGETYGWRFVIPGSFVLIDVLND